MKANTELIQELKSKYGEVFELPVDDKVAYLRKPTMADYKRAFTAMQKGGDITFGEEMLNALFIGGDEEIKIDDAYFLPARKELLSFVNYDDAEVVKKGNKSEILIGEEKCTVRVITREDLKIAEKKNPGGKPFVTQEKLFEMICLEKSDGFNDKLNASIRFPLYQAIESLQNTKVASIKKL